MASNQQIVDYLFKNQEALNELGIFVHTEINIAPLIIAVALLKKIKQLENEIQDLKYPHD